MLNIYEIINTWVCLCVAYFKGKNDTGPPKKKKKCKKKHFKEKVTNEKTPTPKSQQKTSPSTAAQKGPATAKLNGSKTQSINGSATQPPKGTVSVTKLSNALISVCPPV